MARRYEADQVVVHHDTPALSVLCVHSGAVKLMRYARKGQEIVVAVRGPGGMVGVWEVLSGTPNQVSAETLEPSVLCMIPREAFLEAVRGCPELAMRLLQQLARDYLVAEEQLVVRASLGVRARTARLLMALTNNGVLRADGTGSREIGMSRDKMALLVGTTRETLSRTLNDMARRGAVVIKDSKIKLLDTFVLEKLTE